MTTHRPVIISCNGCGYFLRWLHRMGWHPPLLSDGEWTVTPDPMGAKHFEDEHTANKAKRAAGWDYDAQGDWCSACEEEQHG